MAGEPLPLAVEEAPGLIWVRRLALALLAALPVLFYWRLFTPNALDRGSFPAGDFSAQFYAFARYQAESLAGGRLPLWSPGAYSGFPFLADIQSASFYPPRLLTILLARPWGFPYAALEIEAVAHLALAGVFTFLLGERLFRNPGIAFLVALTFTYGGYLTSYPSQQLAILESVVWLPLALLFVERGKGKSVDEVDEPAPAEGPPRHEWSGLPGAKPASAGWDPSVGANLVFALGGSEPAPSRPEDRLRSTVAPGFSPERHPANFLRWSLLCGATLALSILAGHPQTAMLVIYTVAVYAVWRTPTIGGRRPWWGTLRFLAVALIVAGGLAAAQLLPSIEYMRLSSRAQAGYDQMSAGLPVQDLVQVLLPGVVSTYSPLYLGILPLFLVGAALVLRPTRPVRFWFLMAVVALLLSFGNQAFLHSLFYLLAPGWRLFRGQERLALLVAFPLSLVAGYGIQALLHPTLVPPEEKRGFVRAGRVLPWLLGGAVALFFLGLLRDGWTGSSPFYWLLGSAVFVTMVAALSWGLLRWWTGGPRRPMAFLGLAAALLVFDLFTVGWRHNFSSDPPEAREATPAAVAAIQAEAGGDPFRVFNEFRLEGNYGVQFGIQDIWGASPLRLERYERLMSSLTQDRLWPLLNVRYVVTWMRELPLASRIIHEEPAGEETTYVHRLLQFYPRAWLAYRAEILPPDQALERLADPSFDFYRTALIEEAPPLPLDSHFEGGSARVLSSQDESLAVAVQAEANALLVLSEVYYPGWQATVDGRPAPILRADYALRAVPVPAGEHTVELVYRPATVRIGLLLSLVSLVALVVGVAAAPRALRDL